MANLDLLNEFWLRAEKEEKFRPYIAPLRKARPFTLDAELAGIVGGLAHRRPNPKALARYTRAARLPYPEMWIECDFDTAFAFQPEPETGYTWEKPERIGWLLRETDAERGIFTAMRVAKVPDWEKKDGTALASVYPLVHVVHPGGVLSYSESFTNMGNTDPAIVEAMKMWNQDPAFRALAWRGDDPSKMVEVAAFRDNFDSSPLDGFSAAIFEPRFAQRLLEEGKMDMQTRAVDLFLTAMSDQSGELAYIVAALALLNEVPVRYVPFRPSGRFIGRGGTRPFLTSSVVTIEVPATRRRLREIDKHLQARGEAAKRARHEVRGHYRHVYKLPAQHPERWERAVDRRGAPCWRTWIAHHERGSAELGWVQQTYEVVARNGAAGELAAVQ